VDDERGQTTVEWAGLVLVVALAMVALSAVTGGNLPGAALARSIAARLICAAKLDEGRCAEMPDPDPELVAAYGPELAGEIRSRAPTIAYEEGMRALPVDFRSCREDACAEGAEAGEVAASEVGEPVTLFVHAVDCRPGGDAVERGYECEGRRAEKLYLQYWAYYPGSQSWRILSDVGNPGHHPDDWESYQLRIGGGGAMSRASSHHGYSHGGGPGNWASDAGWTTRAGWGPANGQYRVSGGSHAGHIDEPRDELRRSARDPDAPWHAALPRLRESRFAPRWTPRERVRLIPIEPIARRHGERYEFAVTPPWEKFVYRDPEHRGTG